jgi:hypothetical protein
LPYPACFMHCLNSLQHSKSILQSTNHTSYTHQDQGCCCCFSALSYSILPAHNITEHADMVHLNKVAPADLVLPDEHIKVASQALHDYVVVSAVVHCDRASGVHFRYSPLAACKVQVLQDLLLILCVTPRRSSAVLHSLT